MKTGNKLVIVLLLATALLALAAGTALCYETVEGTATVNNADDFIAALEDEEVSAITVNSAVELNRLDDIRTQKPITVAQGGSLTLLGTKLYTRADFTVKADATLNILGYWEENEDWRDEFAGALVMQEPDSFTGVETGAVLTVEGGGALNVGEEYGNANYLASLNLDQPASYVGNNPQVYDGAQFYLYSFVNYNFSEAVNNYNSTPPEELNINRRGARVNTPEGLSAVLNDDHYNYNQIIVGGGNCNSLTFDSGDYALRPGKELFVSDGCNLILPAGSKLDIQNDENNGNGLGRLFVEPGASFTQAGQVDDAGDIILLGANEPNSGGVYTVAADAILTVGDSDVRGWVQVQENASLDLNGEMHISESNIDLRGEVNLNAGAYLENSGYIGLNADGARLVVNNGAELVNRWYGDNDWRNGTVELNNGTRLEIGGVFHNQSYLGLNGFDTQVQVHENGLLLNYGFLRLGEYADNAELNIYGHLRNNGTIQSDRETLDDNPSWIQVYGNATDEYFNYINDDNDTVPEPPLNGALVNYGSIRLRGVLKVATTEEGKHGGLLINFGDLNLQNESLLDVAGTLDNKNYICIDNNQAHFQLSGRLENYWELENHGEFTLTAASAAIHNYGKARLEVGNSATYSTWNEFNPINWYDDDQPAISEDPSLRLGNIDYQWDDNGQITGVNRYSLDGVFYMTRGENRDNLSVYLGYDYSGGWTQLNSSQYEIDVEDTYTDGNGEFSAEDQGDDWDKIDVAFLENQRTENREETEYAYYRLRTNEWGYTRIVFTLSDSITVEPVGMDPITLDADQYDYNNNVNCELPYVWYFYSQNFDENNSVWGDGISYCSGEQELWYLCRDGFRQDEIDDIQFCINDDWGESYTQYITYEVVRNEEKSDEYEDRYDLKLSFQSDAPEENFTLCCKVGNHERRLECYKPVVWVESQIARPGDEVTVRVMTKEMPDFAGFALELSFDANMLEYKSIQWNSALVGNAVVPFNPNGGTVKLVFDQDENLRSDDLYNEEGMKGCLAAVTFKVAPEMDGYSDYSADLGLDLRFAIDPGRGENRDNFAMVCDNGDQMAIHPRLDGGMIEVYRWGDVYRSGSGLDWINIQDAIRLCQLVNRCGGDFDTAQRDYLMRYSEFAAANVYQETGDNFNKINGKDLTALVQYIAGYPVTLPTVEP